MHFPRHWARGIWHGTDRAGRRIERDAWGWSDVSASAARELGEELARRRAESFDPARIPTRRYAYPNRPLREPVLREVAGEVAAVVSRNRYGCEVLNADRAVFVDVDIPPDAPATGLLGSLFGRRRDPENARIAAESEHIAKLDRWQHDHPSSSFRVYRTAAGLRYILTTSVHPPSDPLIDDLFAATGADPAYRQLCQQQQTYRARLTPKPWRCAIDSPAHRYPFETPSAQADMEKWVARYNRAAGSWATCLFLITLGPETILPELESVVALHDAATKAESNLPLA